MNYTQFEICLHFTSTHCGLHKKKEQQSKVNLQVISTAFMRVLHLQACRSSCYIHRAHLPAAYTKRLLYYCILIMLYV
jgi:hypothetical protein